MTYVIWPEGVPGKAVKTSNWLMSQIHLARLGWTVKFPFCRRVRTLIFAENVNMTAVAIATEIERLTVDNHRNDH